MLSLKSLKEHDNWMYESTKTHNFFSFKGQWNHGDSQCKLYQKWNSKCDSVGWKFITLREEVFAFFGEDVGIF